MTKVLILCTGNSCRSQIAHGFLNHFTDNSITVSSAGIEKHGLNKNAVKCMSEIGIDISNHNSNLIEDYIKESFDFIITVCDNAQKVCPTFTGNVKQIHWSIEDPYHGWSANQEDLPPYRETREELIKRIKLFLKK